jgi:hypothetical protein
MHWEPWVLRDIQRVPVVTALPQQIESKSPDGTRIIDIDSYGKGFVHDSSSMKALYIIELKRSELPSLIVPSDFFHSCRFKNDDAIEISSNFIVDGGSRLSYLWDRRFPEWWWGHFYRPEVWLAIVLSGLLLWRSTKALNLGEARKP